MAVDIVSIVVRTLAFVVLFHQLAIIPFTAFFGWQEKGLSDELRVTARWIAFAGLLFVSIHQLLEAARMTGAFAGIMEVSLQRRALVSKTGLANGLRMAGMLAILFGGVGLGRRSLFPGLIGGLLVAISFAATGHTSINPLRGLLAPLLALHLWVVAFWFGALWPLYRATGLEPTVAAAIVRRFSTLATWMVPGIAVAGFCIAAAIVPTWQALWTPYGQLLSGKVLAFSVLMGFASLNKLRLGPALEQGSPTAIRALRSSLMTEFVLITAVLAMTATMTTLYSPTAE